MLAAATHTRAAVRLRDATPPRARPRAPRHHPLTPAPVCEPTTLLARQFRSAMTRGATACGVAGTGRRRSRPSGSCTRCGASRSRGRRCRSRPAARTPPTRRCLRRVEADGSGSRRAAGITCAAATGRARRRAARGAPTSAGAAAGTAECAGSDVHRSTSERRAGVVLSRPEVAGMSRRGGRRGGAGGAALAIVGAPIAVGFYSVEFGIAAILALGAFAWLLLKRPHAVAWFAARRGATLTGIVLCACLLMAGLVAGAVSREDDARAAARLQQNETEMQAGRDRDAAEEAQRRTSARAVEAQRTAERAQVEAIEARRTPSERAALASAQLSGNGTAVDRFCAANLLLAPIPADQQHAADVRTALHALRRAERAALREQRDSFDEGRGLVCGDGEISPSCTCHGSHRGCCSHHGGVRGCEPLPDEVSCPTPSPLKRDQSIVTRSPLSASGPPRRRCCRQQTRRV